MYMLRKDADIKMHQRKASEVIGISEVALSNILNRKVACRKVVAYCITKYINEDAEISDYFEPVQKGE